MKAQRTFRMAFLLVWACGLALIVAACLDTQRNRAPTAWFVALPPSGYEPLTVQFDARASSDPDGDLLTYAWTFDGAETASGAVVVRSFSVGTHTVRLEVADGRGEVDVETGTVSAQAVPEGYVPRNFTWTTGGAAHARTFLIPWDLYQMYKGRIRNSAAESYAYGDYVADPLDDPTIKDYASVFWADTDSVEAFVDDVLSFVQGAIRYRPDPTTQEWPWYPLETLVAGEGDCEDTAILFVSLLRARAVSASLAFVDTDADRFPDHVLALVPVTDAWATRLTCAAPLLTLDEVEYAVAETAADGVPIPLGCDPWDLSSADVYEIWPF